MMLSNYSPRFFFIHLLAHLSSFSIQAKNPFQKQDLIFIRAIFSTIFLNQIFLIYSCRCSRSNISEVWISFGSSITQHPGCCSSDPSMDGGFRKEQTLTIFFIGTSPRLSISTLKYWSILSSSVLLVDGLYRKNQVTIFTFITSHLPTTSNYIYEQANATMFGVYIYPNEVTCLKHVRFWLLIYSDILVLFFFSIYRINQAQFLYTLIINPLTNINWSQTYSSSFCVGYMASSPNSVLDSLLLREAESVCLEDRTSQTLVQALHLTLAGKLLTSRRPSVANLTLFASRIWNCTHRLSCYDHGKCLYSFEFTHAPDVEKVVAGGPWHINGDLLLISRMNPNQSIEQLPFAFSKLWVRCYDLPPMCFTIECAQAIGNSLGKYCETDLPPEDPNEARLLVRKVPTVRKYLRVKFNYNLNTPLKRTQSVKIRNPIKNLVEEHYSRLTYERLPQACFRCGHLGHLVEGCSFEGPLLYGEWIRAEKFFRLNFQNPSIPKSIVTAINIQGSSSSATTSQALQVSNVADLITPVDPLIIRADYSSVRAEGPLPQAKGKNPMTLDSQIDSLVPHNNSSIHNNSSSLTVYGPASTSILGPGPSSQGLPLCHDTMIDSDECQFVTYFNSVAPQEEFFGPNAHRCLFKEDMTNLIPSSGRNSQSSSPTFLSPIKPVEVPVSFAPTAAAQLSKVFTEELRKLPIRKRNAGNTTVKAADTPRAKRGRQPSNPENQAG